MHGLRLSGYSCVSCHMGVLVVCSRLLRTLCYFVQDDWVLSEVLLTIICCCNFFGILANCEEMLGVVGNCYALLVVFWKCWRFLETLVDCWERFGAICDCSEVFERFGTC